MLEKVKEELRDIINYLQKKYICNELKDINVNALIKALIIKNINSTLWDTILLEKQLSEDFLREFHERFDLIHWDRISIMQNLSESFRNDYKHHINIELYNEVHKTKNREEKINEMVSYARKYNLEFDGEYLYAFRNHSSKGHGMYSSNLVYKNGEYYRDWHCDMREYVQNSFGLGIWPKGNTPVKVSVDDWGVWVNRNDGKCRVWGFTVIGERKES